MVVEQSFIWKVPFSNSKRSSIFSLFLYKIDFLIFSEQQRFSEFQKGHLHNILIIDKVMM